MTEDVDLANDSTARSDAGRCVRTIAESLRQLPPPDQEQYAIVFGHGTLEVGMYAPRGHDDQAPHTRDEAYIVARGSGAFVCGRERVQFGPGDFLFVPAHETHRFEDFSDDFAAWVLFYGPEGGEVASGDGGR